MPLFNDFNNDSLVAVAKMALAVDADVPLSTYDDLDVVANFRNPLMPSIASTTDAMVKLAGVVEGFAGTEVFWEQLGFSEDTVRKVTQQVRRNQAQMLVQQTMAQANNAS